MGKDITAELLPSSVLRRVVVGGDVETSPAERATLPSRGFRPTATVGTDLRNDLDGRVTEKKVRCTIVVD